MQSLRRAGAPVEATEDIIEEVEEGMHDGMTTTEILRCVRF